ncbi:uncharacterized protein LOC122870170 [Siniperca chuatsi]|uniref:uncharacterized protein LOC122870170 n=1 Tax=Siniperca chuatsi TaxID=119488 RepID=UPI001CE08D9D|nr:uncharacterized protein LOC122870170 [Siniperca chuatsi]
MKPYKVKYSYFLISCQARATQHHIKEFAVVIQQCVMMTSLKRWCLLPLAAFLLLSFVPAVTEVVDSMSDCDQFLLNGTSPQVPGILEGGNILKKSRYKPICQTFDNVRRFVTLYDTQNKIPVFSAYKFRGENETGRPDTPWKIEPQLEERNSNNMRDDKYHHQATNDDYKNNSVYNRGHLFPASHAFDKSEKISTFTLTNIVPQAVTFNGGSWDKMEKCIKCVLEKYCINNNDVLEGFVVTGAQPSNNNKHNNKINIPSMLWSAFCCYSRDMKKWIASAHWGDNTAESKSKYLQTKSLEDLHHELKTAGSEFNVFPGTQCPLRTTVAEFYPKLKKNCQCPPNASTRSARRTTTTTSTTTTTTKTTKNNSENNEGEGGEGGGALGMGGVGFSGRQPDISDLHPTTSEPQTNTTAQHLSFSTYSPRSSSAPSLTSYSLCLYIFCILICIPD